MRASVRGRPRCRRGCARRGTASPACPRSAGRAARASARTSALPAPASSSGWSTPCSAAARRPGRQSPASSALAPESSARVAALARPAPRARRRARSCRSSSGRPVAPVARAGELVGRDRLVRDADRGGHAARAVQLARGERRGDGGDGERARAQRARGERGHERGVDAARERDDHAVRGARRWPLERRRSSVSVTRPSCVRRGERLRPDRLHRRPVTPRGALAVGVLGREVDDLAVEPADLHAHLLAADLHGAALALELDAVQARDAHAERARLAQDRARDGVLVARPREGGEHEARAAVLHLRRRGPDVERAGGEAGGRRVGRELGQQVVEVRLDQRHRPGGALRPRRRRSRARRSGSSAPSRVPAP